MKDLVKLQKQLITNLGNASWTYEQWKSVDFVGLSAWIAASIGKEWYEQSVQESSLQRRIPNTQVYALAFVKKKIPGLKKNLKKANQKAMLEDVQTQTVAATALCLYRHVMTFAVAALVHGVRTSTEAEVTEEEEEEPGKKKRKT
jgi:hypothetical protein